MVMELSNYARMFKALSNEQRLKVFMMLYAEALKGNGRDAVVPAETASCCPVEKAFTKICDCVNLSRSTISHHFKELQNAGLINCERDGRTYRCRVNMEAIAAIKNFME
ncbi:MAG: metalloregulator ArsR/SmtB family transcription factor [Elusimicrobiaceae bacterium]